MAKNNPAIPARNLIGADAIEKAVGVFPLHLEFGKRRKVHQSDALADRQTFFAHWSPPVGAPKGKLFTFSRRVVPARPLPAENLTELRTFRLQLFIER